MFYQFLPPMLLNEYQKQQHMIEAQAVAIRDQAAAMTLQSMRMAELERNQSMQAAQLSALQSIADARDAQVAELRRTVEILITRTFDHDRLAAEH